MTVFSLFMWFGLNQLITGGTGLDSYYANIGSVNFHINIKYIYITYIL